MRDDYEQMLYIKDTLPVSKVRGAYFEISSGWCSQKTKDWLNTYNNKIKNHIYSFVNEKIMDDYNNLNRLYSALSTFVETKFRLDKEHDWFVIKEKSDTSTAKAFLCAYKNFIELDSVLAAKDRGLNKTKARWEEEERQRGITRYDLHERRIYSNNDKISFQQTPNGIRRNHLVNLLWSTRDHIAKRKAISPPDRLQKAERIAEELCLSKEELLRIIRDLNKSFSKKKFPIKIETRTGILIKIRER